MALNADFSERVLVHAAQMEWRPSPMPGVHRRPLDRIGDEVARATSIVRYAPDSHFSAHVHEGGEEFIVLSGTFQDEHGDYPAGTYVRNPVGTSHTPGSNDGCVIFVKLWQFDPEDQVPMRLNMLAAPGAADPARPGVAVTPLFETAEERVVMETWAAGTQARWDADGGAEILMLAGSAREGRDPLGPESWLRVPDGARVEMEAGPDGARFWMKSGHLRHIRVPEAAGG